MNTDSHSFTSRWYSKSSVEGLYKSVIGLGKDGKARSGINDLAYGGIIFKIAGLLLALLIAAKN